MRKQPLKPLVIEDTDPLNILGTHLVVFSRIENKSEKNGISDDSQIQENLTSL